MKPFRWHVLVRLAGLGGVALAVHITAATPLSIWSPRSATPAFVEPGSTFVAEVFAPSALPATGWQAVVTSDLGHRWPCRILTAVVGEHNLDLGAKSGWQLTIQVPREAAPELCGVTITAPGGAVQERRRAVSIVPELESSFYIVVLTDDHLYSDRVDAGRSAEQKKSGFHSADLVRLTTRVANLAHPRFVLKTGDFATSQAVSRKFAIQQWMIPALSDFRVPTIISAGNHEFDIWSDVAKTRPAEYTPDLWEQDFGSRSFVTRLGSLYILSHEFGNAQDGPRFDADLLERVKTRYRADRTNLGIRYRLVTQHGLDGRLGSFFPEMVDDTCDLMLSGHDHQTVIRRPGPPYYRLAVTAAQEWGRCVWFEFVRPADGSWSCPQANSAYGDTNTVELVNDARGPDLKLKQQFMHPNDGTTAATTNVCTITNEIPFRFSDGRVRFLMPRGRYAVAGGICLGQYDYESAGGTRTAVLCRVSIPAKEHATGVATVRVSSLAQGL